MLQLSFDIPQDVKYTDRIKYLVKQIGNCHVMVTYPSSSYGCVGMTKIKVQFENEDSFIQFVKEYFISP